jgi:hypothetical protein
MMKLRLHLGAPRNPMEPPPSRISRISKSQKLKPSLPQRSQRPHFMSKKAAACLMAEVASSPIDESSNVLSFRDCLAGRRVSLALVPDGILQSPEQLRAPIMKLLEFIMAEARFSALRSPLCKHRRQQALPPLGCVVAECSPCGRVRLMIPCVAFACQRLATAPASMYVTYRTTGRWAAWIMERVTWGRVKKVQVRLAASAPAAARMLCCALRWRASACVHCVFDACCSKRWLVLRCVAAHRSGYIKRAAAFTLVCRLLLPPALQADPTF